MNWLLLEPWTETLPSEKEVLALILTKTELLSRGMFGGHHLKLSINMDK